MDHLDQLLAAARQQTSLTNFGNEDFLEGAKILVDACDREARLNDFGRMATDGQIVTLLANRLQIEDWYTRHPEIDEQQIIAPLIGLGLPRTGSSALSMMLGEDPAVRSIRNWEAMWPCPPPETATYDTDPRIAATEASMAQRAVLFPRMPAMLPSSATSPMECQLFMGLDFKSQIFMAFAQIPSYGDWLLNKANLVPTYHYVKRVLKLLQWRCPGRRWNLKNPSHSLFIDALDRVFPDANFVMTHRDVAAVIPSVSDLYLELRRVYSDNPDLHAIGNETKSVFETGMHRMIIFRDSGQEHRFFDIHFAPFQKDPFPSIEALYAFLGEDFTPQARANMQGWWTSTPPEERRYERTDPAAFGLNRNDLRRQFQFYASRFNVTA